jgi:hypothetical protein
MQFWSRNLKSNTAKIPNSPITAARQDNRNNTISEPQNCQLPVPDNFFRIRCYKGTGWPALFIRLLLSADPEVQRSLADFFLENPESQPIFKQE